MTKQKPVVCSSCGAFIAAGQDYYQVLDEINVCMACVHAITGWPKYEDIYCHVEAKKGKGKRLDMTMKMIFPATSGDN